jgi:protein gp37
VSDKTGIEWTEATWNPVLGCTAVSPGCDNCYAAREASGRLRTHPLYVGLAEAGTFTGKVRLVPERLGQPLRWHRPRRIFVNSMSDLFHDSVPDGFIGAVFEVMARTPRHTFQVLTKRHGRMRSLLRRWTATGLTVAQYRDGRHQGDVTVTAPLWTPPPNVWLGVSVESQLWADIRIPALLGTPAAVRWISAEPLVGPIDLLGPVHIDGGRHRPRLTYWLPPGRPRFPPGPPGSVLSEPLTNAPALEWVVAGGESGPNARPMHPDWARQLRDQCADAGVPYLFKQWGEFAPFGADQTMQRVGKKFAGRRLDGRTWDEYPAGDR